MTEPQNNDKQEPVKPRSRGIYLLPNLFTTGALFSGFYAVVASMNGHFENAAIAIFVAMVLDGLDGRVARMTNTSSAFGAEYDSLADMVSFGVAPSLVVFNWVLDDIGKLGWFAAFVYVAGAALRLARFNTQIGSTDKRYFIGLPSPAAAAAALGRAGRAAPASGPSDCRAARRKCLGLAAGHGARRSLAKPDWPVAGSGAVPSGAAGQPKLFGANHRPTAYRPVAGGPVSPLPGSLAALSRPHPGRQVADPTDQ